MSEVLLGVVLGLIYIIEWCQSCEMVTTVRSPLNYSRGINRDHLSRKPVYFDDTIFLLLHKKISN